MACLCLPLNLEESFSNSDYVLVAQLISAKVIDHTYSIGDFEVSDVLKGDPPEIISLKTAHQTSGSCGVVILGRRILHSLPERRPRSHLQLLRQWKARGK